MKLPEPNDLLKDFQDGNANAFTKIVKMNNRLIRYFAWTIVKDREAAEEIANDSFLKVWQSRTNFKTLDAIKSFLYLVTRNACLNAVKSSRYRQRESMVEAEQLLSSDPDVETRLIELELLDTIYREIGKLPDKQRNVFQLTYLDGLSVSEIAEKLGITPNAVYLNKSLALKALQRVFKPHDLILCFLFSRHFWEN